jgi:hypothetical protein
MIQIVVKRLIIDFEAQENWSLISVPSPGDKVRNPGVVEISSRLDFGATRDQIKVPCD